MQALTSISIQIGEKSRLFTSDGVNFDLKIVMEKLNSEKIMSGNMIKIGVVGAGHLGRMHIKNLIDIPEVDLVGFYDSDKRRSIQISKEFGGKAFNSIELLLEHCDGISIVVPTVAHYDVALKAIKNKVHVFCEKPFMKTVKEANEVIEAARKNSITLQVGHIERFNPALTSLRHIKMNPLFIESHRITPYNPRGTDVAVILDLMIHDIDIILSLVNSQIKHIDATGAPVLTDNIDIANARVKFENGCVANITASRISLKKMRKLRIFQERTYISIDFLQNLTEIYRIATDEEESPPNAIVIAEVPFKSKLRKKIYYEKLEAPRTNALYKELKEFADAIKNGTTPPVTGEDGKRALEVAVQIESQIKSTLKNLDK